MICRSSTTGMSEHPDVTALAQDALGSTNRAEQAVRCLQGADRRARRGTSIRRSGCANNFRLCRGRLAALGSDSAYDHEILHTYSLPGIIMRGCHALISATCAVDVQAPWFTVRPAKPPVQGGSPAEAG